MSGIESNLGQEGWQGDEDDGLFPQSVRFMWQSMTRRHE
eukprot:CAMPEP_0116870272 /NCGR_PEP_ID=MMETSP0463-20121206/132_1 /TAXON_ID=181622 /ORGANISM="Strombidinopsis sp, Strain SopsisLIS2011" /LENGTH=38 /DNA_ID= /DNA_START= /DNA_END= /DNA_ORIENTATION=